MALKVDGTNSQLLFFAGTANQTTLRASPTSALWTLTLPTGPGTAGQVLTTDGAGNLSWSTGGGGGSIAVVNDTTTTSNHFPLFSAASSGTLTSVSTSNPKYTFNPASGQLSAPYVASTGGMDLNPNTIPQSFTLPLNYNTVSGGPIATPVGVTVTVNAGSRWTIV